MHPTRLSSPPWAGLGRLKPVHLWEGRVGGCRACGCWTFCTKGCKSYCGPHWEQTCQSWPIPGGGVCVESALQRLCYKAPCWRILQRFNVHFKRRPRARSETFHCKPLPVLGMFSVDLVDAPASCTRCLPLTPTPTGRAPWKHPARSSCQGFHQKVIAADNSEFLSLPSFLLLLLLLLTSPKSIKRIQICQADSATFGLQKKKFQVGKQWAGNRKAERAPPEITPKKGISGFGNLARRILYVFVYGSQRI